MSTFSLFIFIFAGIFLFVCVCIGFSHCIKFFYNKKIEKKINLLQNQLREIEKKAGNCKKTAYNHRKTWESYIRITRSGGKISQNAYNKAFSQMRKSTDMNYNYERKIQSLMEQIADLEAQLITI